MNNRLILPLIVSVALTGCGGALDMGALLGSLPQHLECTMACAACIQALHADGADEQPPAAHVACAGHCAGCASGMVTDIAEIASAGDVEPAPIVGGPVCLEPSEPSEP